MLTSKNRNNYFYYKSNEGYVTVSYDSDEIKVLQELDLTGKCGNFPLMYCEGTHENLLQYKKDMIAYNDEIMQTFFSIGEKKFRVNMFNFYNFTHMAHDLLIMNVDTNLSKLFKKVTFSEFALFQNCLTCGLMTINKDIIGVRTKLYSYDFKKFYYNIMQKLRIPYNVGKFKVINEITGSMCGIFRVRINFTNPLFLNVFKLNPYNHYTHNTIKVLTKFKEKYGITLTLLPVDDDYDYNYVEYTETVEMKKLFKDYFKVFNELQSKCRRSNKLLKNIISKGWGVLSEFNREYLESETDLDDLDWEHLNHIDAKNKYDYYRYNTKDESIAVIPSAKPFKTKYARIKVFLTEFCRNYMFEFISSRNLEPYVARIFTDGFYLTKPCNFTDISYAPQFEGEDYYVWRNVMKHD